MNQERDTLLPRAADPATALTSLSGDAGSAGGSRRAGGGGSLTPGGTRRLTVPPESRVGHGMQRTMRGAGGQDAGSGEPGCSARCREPGVESGESGAGCGEQETPDQNHWEPVVGRPRVRPGSPDRGIKNLGEPGEPQRNSGSRRMEFEAGS